MAVAHSHGEATFCVWPMSQGKIALGKFPWTRQKEPKNYPKVKEIKTQSEQLGKLITISDRIGTVCFIWGQQTPFFKHFLPLMILQSSQTVQYVFRWCAVHSLEKSLTVFQKGEFGLDTGYRKCKKTYSNFIQAVFRKRIMAKSSTLQNNSIDNVQQQKFSFIQERRVVYVFKLFLNIFLKRCFLCFCFFFVGRPHFALLKG